MLPGAHLFCARELEKLRQSFFKFPIQYGGFARRIQKLYAKICIVSYRRGLRESILGTEEFLIIPEILFLCAEKMRTRRHCSFNVCTLFEPGQIRCIFSTNFGQQYKRRFVNNLIRWSIPCYAHKPNLRTVEIRQCHQLYHLLNCYWVFIGWPNESQRYRLL